MPSNTKENYLKAIYAIEENYEKVSLSALSRKMKVSTPTANNMVKRLQEAGLVNYKRYKPLQLTTEGKNIATTIVRRHRLAEMFLVQEMGFSWELVHDIAEEMEHINSQVFFDRIDELLHFPTVDPHGTPIPDKDGNMITQEYIPLTECKEGTTVVLKSLTEEATEFLLFLNDKEIELNTTITITKIEPFDKSRLVSYKDKKAVILTKEVCDRLLVEVAPQ